MLRHQLRFPGDLFTDCSAQCGLLRIYVVYGESLFSWTLKTHSNVRAVPSRLTLKDVERQFRNTIVQDGWLKVIRSDKCGHRMN